MIRRFVLVLGVALVLQGTAFALYYDDLLFLRQPLSRITAGSAETFVRHARTSLDRPKLTVKHLDTIADAAAAFDQHDVEVTALERRLTVTPDDWRVRAKLGDALRRAGRFAEAEAIYLALLSSSGIDQP